MNSDKDAPKHIQTLPVRVQLNNKANKGKIEALVVTPDIILSWIRTSMDAPTIDFNKTFIIISSGLPLRLFMPCT